MRVSRLPSFGELPMRADTFIPGEYTPLPKFSLTTVKESEQNIRPSTVYDRTWVEPKPVSRIGGARLATYSQASNEFRKVGKERIFKRLMTIPSPIQEPEVQSFEGVPIQPRTLGQTSTAQTETGEWGNLVSALSTGFTKYLELTKGTPIPVQTTMVAPQQASILSTSSSLLPILIIGGVAFMIFRSGGLSKITKRRRSR